MKCLTRGETSLDDEEEIVEVESSSATTRAVKSTRESQKATAVPSQSQLGPREKSNQPAISPVEVY